MIGVGVTTYRRPEMASRCIESIEMNSEGVEYILHVNDDSFSEQGVAKSKNANLDFLMKRDVDHIFLFDDDTWPIKPEWWKPYVESGDPHLSYIFKPPWDDECHLITNYKYIFSHPQGTGCMQYYSRKAIETVGGFRPVFGRWGYEHLEHSWRIHRMIKEQVAPFTGLVAQEGLFYASDQHALGLSALDPTIRNEHRLSNNAKYLYWREREEFVPWS